MNVFNIGDALAPRHTAPQPPFGRHAAELLWDRIQMSVRVSSTSLAYFASLTGFYPTVHGAESMKVRFPGTEEIVEGFFAERWTLNDAPERFAPTGEAYHTVAHGSPAVLPVDHPCVAGQPNLPLYPCPICLKGFTGGQYVRYVPLRAYLPPGSPTPPPPQPCGKPDCVCHLNPPPEGENLSYILIHAEHAFAPDAPRPDPAEVRRAKLLRAVLALPRARFILWLSACADAFIELVESREITQAFYNVAIYGFSILFLAGIIDAFTGAPLSGRGMFDILLFLFIAAHSRRQLPTAKPWPGRPR